MLVAQANRQILCCSSLQTGSFSLLNCNRYQVFMLHSNMQTSDQKKVLKNPPAGVRKIVSIIRSFMFYFCYSLVYFHINLNITFHFRSFPPILLKQESLSMMLSLLLILVRWRRYVCMNKFYLYQMKKIEFQSNSYFSKTSF